MMAGGRSCVGRECHGHVLEHRFGMILCAEETPWAHERGAIFETLSTARHALDTMPGIFSTDLETAEGQDGLTFR